MRRGALPGRNPGMRTSREIFLNAAPTASSNSCSSTRTESLTLLPSRGSTLVSIRRRVYRRSPRSHPPVGPRRCLRSPPVEVEVVRSARRRKTVQAHVVEGRLRVHVPARMSRAEEAHWVSVMMRRFERRRTTAGIDLAARARRLAASCLLPPPASLCWVDNQGHQWGSCTPDDGTTRLSSRIASYPRWLRDCVIGRGLAHPVRTPHA